MQRSRHIKPLLTVLLELQGMGKNMWKNIDAQKYVDKERASWNG